MKTNVPLKVAEFEQREAAWRQALQQSVVDTLAVRFPDASISLIGKVRQVEELLELQRLHQAVLTAADLESVERLLSRDRVP